MKVMTILGTRPEIIRLSNVIEKLDRLCTHILVHTGQNFEKSLNEVFFEELGVRKPDYTFSLQADTFGAQIGQIIANTESVMLKERPDRLLILGDTNSGLSAIPAKRLGIPVFHMEAGNRCFDDRVPEEVNRRVIDHSSDVLMPYTERSRQNLLDEGIHSHKIHVTGNPILEVIKRYRKLIDASNALSKLSLTKKKYFMVTMHRAENVDIAMRLSQLTEAMKLLAREYDFSVIISTHPRTKSKLEKFGITSDEARVKFLPPFGFPDFLALEENACCVLTDSGTVQEECCILRVPNVTIRDTTERPETIDVGSNILSGVSPDAVLQSVRVVLSKAPDWQPPAEYLVENVSQTVVKIVLGYTQEFSAISHPGLLPMPEQQLQVNAR